VFIEICQIYEQQPVYYISTDMADCLHDKASFTALH